MSKKGGDVLIIPCSASTSILSQGKESRFKKQLQIKLSLKPFELSITYYLTTSLLRLPYALEAYLY